METVPEKVIDLLEVKTPALSTTSDMPVVETKPDASPPEAEAVPPPVEDGEAEQSDESATSATETPGQPAAPRGVGKKIAELTRKIDEERRRAELSDERLNKALEALSKTTHVEESDEPVRPVKADYPDADGWDEALMLYAEQKASYTAKKEVETMLAQEAEKASQAAIAEGQRVAREAYQARMDKTKVKYADFEEVAQSPEVQVSIPMAHAIIHSEHGPEIQYFLGKNPEEAKRISTLSPPLQLVELGLIVAKIQTPPPKPVISSVPKPLKPLKGGESTAQKDPSEMSPDEYVTWRRSAKS